ncbi:MAG: hypothetical protein HY866_11860, partial [Chloroflexi bacterium]|nr:hypothetical protein [Chloroflexota bacterium]
KKRQELISLQEKKAQADQKETIQLSSFSQKDLAALAVQLIGKLNLPLEQDQIEIAALKMVQPLQAAINSTLEITRAFLAR